MTTAAKTKRTRTRVKPVDELQPPNPPVSIAHIKIRIEQSGTHGMLMYAGGERIAFNQKRAPNVKDTRPPREQASDGLYIGTEEYQGKIVLPSPNLLACIVNAGRFVKQGRRQLSTQRESILAGPMELLESESLLIPQEWEIFTAVPVNALGSRSVRYMPYFPHWALDISVRLDCRWVELRLFREVVDVAGTLIGLGPMRPERKRCFGRFCVTRWEVEYGASK